MIMNNSYEDKTLTWSKEDFHAIVASLTQEDINHMLYKLCYVGPDTVSPESIVYNYISLIAYEAEMRQDDRTAETLYSILYAIE